MSLQDNEDEPIEPSSLKTREPFPPVNEWNLAGPPSTTGPTETIPNICTQSEEVSRILCRYICFIEAHVCCMQYMYLECCYWFSACRVFAASYDTVVDAETDKNKWFYSCESSCYSFNDSFWNIWKSRIIVSVLLLHYRTFIVLWLVSLFVE